VFKIMTLADLTRCRASLNSHLEALGLKQLGAVHYQLSVPLLIEAALRKQEGVLSDTGALVVETGQYTGRSPEDRYIVDTPSVTNDIDWGKVNRPLPEADFERIYQKMLAYLEQKTAYVFDGFAGADPEHALPVRFITELASHNVFVHQLFIRPTLSQLEEFTPQFTVIAVPGLKLNPDTEHIHSEAAVIIHFDKRLVLVDATQYAGEMKKSIFSVMNFLMPAQGVLPMHCSANVSRHGETALFFGLSGTGKTTLSADPDRLLVGDDEHGWSEQGIFNFEGGCYAKTIKLSAEHEPEIFGAIKFGALCENLVLDPDSRVPDYNDAHLTENTRVAYPIDHIPHAILEGRAGHPKTIIFLTADAFGVMPAIAKLSAEQAQYHFMSGYTSKLAGTERGITEPKAVFSSCFGSPFMPRPSAVYAALLKERIEAHHVQVFLINTGWQGGPYGVGERMSLPHTRAMVTAALTGALNGVPYETQPILNLSIPQACPGVPTALLNPKTQWANPLAYDEAARNLATLFVENFTGFAGANHLAVYGPTP
jgi:phosphoenolpyruvate carboxykinase (ATP)